MADAVSELESTIQRLRIRYDNMSDARVKEKKALEDEIRGLQDQLEELKQAASAPKPPADNPMEREAKQNIDALKDILGADDQKAQLQKALAEERKARDDILKQPYNMDTPDYIRDSDNTIRDLEHKLNALDPVTEDLDLLADSGDAIVARDAAAKAKRDKEAAEKAARVKARAKSDEYNQLGPSERAVIDEQTTILAGLDNPHLPLELVDARKKDDVLQKGIKEGRKAGCATSPTVLGGIGIGVAVVIAVILVLLNGGSDDKKAPVSADGSAQQSAGGGATASGDSDVAKFAGHYVLASGFKDPKTAIAFQLSDAYTSVVVTAVDGEFDVDATGKITGGALHVKDHAVSPNLTCDFAFDSTGVSGSVGVYGDVGAIGQIVWTGTHTTSLCSDSVSESAQIYQIGIVTDDVTICGTNMQPTLKDCQDPYPVIVGTFVKQG